MKKTNIVKHSRDFTRIIKTKKPYKNKYFIIYVEKTEDLFYHFGISVSKKLCNAVTRNKMKRRIKSIIDKKDYKKGFNCIIIVRRSVLNLEYQKLEEELFEMIKKLKLEKGEKNEKKNENDNIIF
jgi:ribonuclease P protein component